MTFVCCCPSRFNGWLHGDLLTGAAGHVAKVPQRVGRLWKRQGTSFNQVVAQSWFFPHIWPGVYVCYGTWGLSPRFFYMFVEFLCEIELRSGVAIVEDAPVIGFMKSIIQVLQYKLIKESKFSIIFKPCSGPRFVEAQSQCYKWIEEPFHKLESRHVSHTWWYLEMIQNHQFKEKNKCTFSLDWLSLQHSQNYHHWVRALPSLHDWLFTREKNGQSIQYEVFSISDDITHHPLATLRCWDVPFDFFYRSLRNFKIHLWPVDRTKPILGAGFERCEIVGIRIMSRSRELGPGLEDGSSVTNTSVTSVHLFWPWSKC